MLFCLFVFFFLTNKLGSGSCLVNNHHPMCHILCDICFILKSVYSLQFHFQCLVLDVFHLSLVVSPALDCSYICSPTPMYNWSPSSFVFVGSLSSVEVFSGLFLFFLIFLLHFSFVPCLLVLRLLVCFCYELPSWDTLRVLLFIVKAFLSENPERPASGSGLHSPVLTLCTIKSTMVRRLNRCLMTEVAALKHMCQSELFNQHCLAQVDL